MALGAPQAGKFLRFLCEKRNIRGRFYILLCTLTLPKLGGVAIAVVTRTKESEPRDVTLVSEASRTANHIKINVGAIDTETMGLQTRKSKNGDPLQHHRNHNWSRAEN